MRKLVPFLPQWVSHDPICRVLVRPRCLFLRETYPKTHGMLLVFASVEDPGLGILTPCGRLRIALRGRLLFLGAVASVEDCAILNPVDSRIVLFDPWHSEYQLTVTHVDYI